MDSKQDTSFLNVQPIPTKNWKQNLDNYELKEIRDKQNKNEFVKNRKLHYLWYNYLKLALDLERVRYTIRRNKSGTRSLIKTTGINETKVIVNKRIYKDWYLRTIPETKFHEWYKNPRNFDLFYGEDFKLSGHPKYEVLVRRFNIFIEYQNRMRRYNYTRGDMSQRMKVSEDIIKKYHNDYRMKERINPKKAYDGIVVSDVRNCEGIILSVCEGRFTK